MKIPIYIPVTKQEYVPYEKSVVEHRAPTDESIRLYDEMIDKVRSHLVSTITTENNPMSFRAAVFFEPQSFSYVCKYSVILNGKEFTGDFPLDADTPSRPVDVAQKVAKMLADQLARSIVPDLVRTTPYLRNK